MTEDFQSWMQTEAEAIKAEADEVKKSIGKGRIDAESIALQAYAGMTRLLARVKAMQDRMVVVEQRGVRYRGVYQRSEDYKRGDLVTFDGSMWHATRDTADEPGASRDWQLAVKKGRDA